MWEDHIVSLFQELLRLDPSLGVIDIGANIGERGRGREGEGPGVRPQTGESKSEGRERGEGQG